MMGILGHHQLLEVGIGSKVDPLGVDLLAAGTLGHLDIHLLQGAEVLLDIHLPQVAEGHLGTHLLRGA